MRDQRGRTATVLVVVSAFAGLIAAALAVPAVRHFREVPPTPAPSLRAAWVPPADVALGAGVDYPFGLAIAPDGRQLAFPASRDGEVSLWLADLRTGAERALPGTEFAAMPFWSPDGARLGFFSAGAIRAVALDTALVSDITPAASAGGASWNAAGDLVFATAAGNGIQLRSADGTVRTLTAPDAQAGETAHLLPVFLDDGRHIVFLVRAAAPSREGVWLASLDAPEARERLTRTDAHAVVSRGRLVYANGSALAAQVIDVAAHRLSGPVSVLGVDVGRGPLGQLSATASPDVVMFGPATTTLRELVWTTRGGDRVGTVGGPADLWSVRIAPDGLRVAATELSPQLRTLDIVLFDGADPVPQRVSLSTDADELPAWSPDGRRIAWTSSRRSVKVRGAGAVLPEDVVATFDDPVRVSDWTPDGRGVLVSRSGTATRDDIWLVPADGTGEPRAVVVTPFADVQGTVSPDGRWIAYASDESGIFEVYVESFRDRSPGSGTRVRVTNGGGSDPRWRRDGRELFFRRGSEIHVAMLASGRGQIAVSSTAILLDTGAGLRSFDVSPDGQRFLLNLHKSGAPAAPPVLLFNWGR